MRMIHSLWLLFAAISLNGQPLNDICERKIIMDRRPLAYAPIQERDIFWQKRVVRVIDFREKMNQYFQSPQHHFIEILFEGIQNGKISVYDVEGEYFSRPLKVTELLQMVNTTDTIEVYDLDSAEPEFQVIQNDLDYNSITSIRLLETWFFDSQTSQLKVRILGIAPILTVYDDFGNKRYDKPLFWLHYPGARDYLAQQQLAHDSQSHQTISWEDQLERRFFASTIFQVSNIRGDRLKDRYSGIHLLEQAEKEKQEIFNFEHDLWSY